MCAFRNRCAIVAAAIVVTGALPVQARAAFTLSFAGTTEMGSVSPAPSTINTTDPTTFTVKDTGGHAEFTVTITATTTNVSNDGILTNGMSLTVADDESGFQTDTLMVTLSSTPYNFTNGVSPATLTLTSTVTGANLPTFFDSGSFQSSAQNNITSANHSTPTQNTNFFGTWPSANFITFTNSAPGNPSLVPYTLQNVFSLTLHGGDSVSVTGTTQLTGSGPPVQDPTAPEPGTMVMAIAGIPLVILGTWLRRRRRRLPA
jgi:hypothetical protein